MAITHVVSSTPGQADDNPVTGTIDTTGADLLVVAAINHNSGTTGTLIDSKSNASWVGLTVPTLNNVAKTRLFYHTNSPTVGAGHTFTYSGTGVYGAIIAMAFAGADATAPFDVEAAGASNGSGLTIQPGSLTPSQDDSLIVTASGFDATSNGMSIDLSFTTPVTVDLVALARGLSMSYLIQTAAGAVNPTWTSVNNNAQTAVMAAFKPGSVIPQEPGPIVFNLQVG